MNIIVSFCAGIFIGAFMMGLIAGASHNDHVSQEVERIKKQMEAELCETKK